MLQMKAVEKKFGKKEVVKGVTAHIRPGEIVGLVGENGAGKSTLLQIIASLIKPTAGQLTLNGLDYDKQLKEIRRQIGFVPQEISLWEHLSVKENMTFFESLSWKKRSKEALRQLCLGMNLHAWEERVDRLSGGTRRKLNLAVSLIHEPKLLLLDEPTVGIDLRSKLEIADYLRKLSREQGVTIIYISHDMDEIVQLCDYTLCLGRDSFYVEKLRERGQKVYRIDQGLAD